MSDWSPAFIVSEDEQLSRCLLHKSRIAVASNTTVYFNEEAISPALGRALLLESGFDPDSTGSKPPDQVIPSTKVHEAWTPSVEDSARTQISGTHESTGAAA